MPRQSFFRRCGIRTSLQFNASKRKLDQTLANVENLKIRAKHYPRSSIISCWESSFPRSKPSKHGDHLGELVDQVAFVDYNPGRTARANLECCRTLPDLWRRMSFGGTEKLTHATLIIFEITSGKLPRAFPERFVER